jgi:hypothetical protein
MDGAALAQLVLVTRLLRRIGNGLFCPGGGSGRLRPGLCRRRARPRPVVLGLVDPISVLTGFTLMVGYGLLGAGWLINKSQFRKVLSD